MKNLKPCFNLSPYLIFLSIGFVAYQAKAVNLPEQNLQDKNSQVIQYLQCYPLNQENKKQCIKALDQYVPSDYKADAELYTQFVYDMEKLGFAHFLIKNGKECKKIDDGPIYSEQVTGYEVKCINEEHKVKLFYMRFDYDKDQWSIIDTE